MTNLKIFSGSNPLAEKAGTMAGPVGLLLLNFGLSFISKMGDGAMKFATEATTIVKDGLLDAIKIKMKSFVEAKRVEESQKLQEMIDKLSESELMAYLASKKQTSENQSKEKKISPVTSDVTLAGANSNTADLLDSIE